MFGFDQEREERIVLGQGKRHVEQEAILGESPKTQHFRLPSLKGQARPRMSSRWAIQSGSSLGSSYFGTLLDAMFRLNKKGMGQADPCT